MQELLADVCDRALLRMLDEIGSAATVATAGPRYFGFVRRTAMRVSVSSWATADEDVERSLQAVLRIAGETR